VVCWPQALQLVSDVHVLADRVRVKVHGCGGAKTPERGLSGLLTPRNSGLAASSQEQGRGQVKSPPWHARSSARHLPCMQRMRCLEPAPVKCCLSQRFYNSLGHCRRCGVHD
jgi:hypothetical protein